MLLAGTVVQDPHTVVDLDKIAETYWHLVEMDPSA